MSGTKKKMKLPKSVMNRMATIEKTSLNASVQPTTSEEFYNEGVNNEESGDRWFSSDLSKALRFYYKAYLNYKESLKLNPTNADVLYNLPRLQYEVYGKYTKDDAVILADLDNCANALSDNSPGGFFQNIIFICRNFEASINTLMQSGQESSVGWDFYYNLAMAYFEYIETSMCDSSLLGNLNADSHIIGAIQKCIFMFDKILDQTLENLNNKDENQFLELEALCGLCIESYRMVSSIYESLFTPQLLQIMDRITANFIFKIDEMSKNLLEQQLEPETLINLKISKLKERAARALDYEEFIAAWDSEIDLHSNIEKQLTETSATRSFLDKFDTVGIKIEPSLRWKILSVLSSKYRIISDFLRETIKELEGSNNSDSDDLSTQICLLCAVYIERADIDLERSILDVAEAVQNQVVLQNNCKSFLKNALIFSKKSGGLKESVAGKLMRKKKQREAAMRLCLFERKTQEECNIIIGKEYFPLELKEISEIEAYKRLFS